MLDRLVNPHWPYLPEKTKELGENSDRIELAWSSVPDDPMNYDFFYHVLDADDQGREPKIDERTLNELFNPKSMSCLRCIAESDDKVTLMWAALKKVMNCCHIWLLTCIIVTSVIQQASKVFECLTFGSLSDCSFIDYMYLFVYSVDIGREFFTLLVPYPLSLVHVWFYLFLWNSENREQEKYLVRNVIV